MAAPQPTARTPQAPPDIPPLQGVPPTLIKYLQDFGLWCRHGFANKLSGSTALPGLMLQAYDAPAGTNPKVFLVRVNTSGVLSATPMPLGSGGIGPP